MPHRPYQKGNFEILELYQREGKDAFKGEYATPLHFDMSKGNYPIDTKTYREIYNSEWSGKLAQLLNEGKGEISPGSPIELEAKAIFARTPNALHRELMHNALLKAETLIDSHAQINLHSTGKMHRS